MDVVLRQLENTSITPNDSDNKTSFDVLYKNWGKLGNQEERRKEILGVQKNNRNTKLDKYRGILELVQAVQDDVFKNHHGIYYRPSIYVAGFNKAPSYSEVLMMSEWMIEKPSDFDKNWMVVPAPKGTRALLVASNGVTRLFTKYGHQMFQCRTGLPGGNPIDPKSKTNCCVLDCFYQKKTNMLYILDILAWNSLTMTDGEFEFRDFWMRSQLATLPAIRTLNKRNELNFNLLPKVSCAPGSFKPFMMKIHFGEDITILDGLLFFHKRAHYFSGETPLVGWLYPYMVPEVLGSDINVNPAYMIQKPESYTNQAEFIAAFNAKIEKKNKPKGPRSRRTSVRETVMDTADIKTEATPGTITKPKTDDKPNTECMEADAIPDSAINNALNERTSESKTSANEKPALTIAAMEAETIADIKDIDNNIEKDIEKFIENM